MYKEIHNIVLSFDKWYKMVHKQWVCALGTSPAQKEPEKEEETETELVETEGQSA